MNNPKCARWYKMLWEGEGAPGCSCCLFLLWNGAAGQGKGLCTQGLVIVYN